MRSSTATLNDLIEVLEDSLGFLELAGERSTSTKGLDVIERIRRSNIAIISDLKAEVSLNGGEPVSEGTWLGSFRHNYVELKAMLTDDPEASYLGALAEQEDRILDAFREATLAASGRIRELAESYLPEMEKSRRQLQEILRP